ncbi:MAG: phosphatidylserine decarboxylase family protein [Verrucomicrobia bacterium]|nr:phosphatidylserine decarboxylase family protein [Verrucomicrobiota bacterium]
MKHAGKARQDGIGLMLRSFAIVALFGGGGALAVASVSAFKAAAGTLILAWILFALFCLNFFRDPQASVPADPNAIVAPAHGRVDLIEEATESEFISGPCRRISTFLSVFDVHIQNAPVSGRISFIAHRPGKFFNAMKVHLSAQNENVLIGLESSERPGERIAVRLIAGLIARRIVPWVVLNEVVHRGERTSLIRFGSRVDLYLPLTAKVCVRLGDRVKGGETIVATRT